MGLVRKNTARTGSTVYRVKMLPAANRAADYVDQCVEERQQHDQGGYDPRYEPDERLATGLEQPDEPLARALQRAEYPALRRRSLLFLEQRDEDCIHNLSSLK
jgi:hypothetical protein